VRWGFWLHIKVGPRVYAYGRACYHTVSSDREIQNSDVPQCVGDAGDPIVWELRNPAGAA
jgi:hypothetical protein